MFEMSYSPLDACLALIHVATRSPQCQLGAEGAVFSRRMNLEFQEVWPFISLNFCSQLKPQLIICVYLAKTQCAVDSATVNVILIPESLIIRMDTNVNRLSIWCTSQQNIHQMLMDLL